MCTYTVPSGSRVVPGGDCKNLDEAGRLREYGRALRFGGETCQLARTANTQRDIAYRRRRAKADRAPAPRAKAGKAKAAPKGKSLAEMTRDELVRLYGDNGLGTPPKSWPKNRIIREMGKALR